MFLEGPGDLINYETLENILKGKKQKKIYFYIQKKKKIINK